MIDNVLAKIRLGNIKDAVSLGNKMGYEPHHIQELIDYVVSTEIRDKDNATALRMAAEGMDKLKAELAKVQKWNDNQRKIIEDLRNKPDSSEQAEAWIKIAHLLSDLDPNWATTNKTGIESAKATITNWHTKAEKFEVLLESLDDALDEATSPDEVRSEDELVLFFDEMSKLYPTGWLHTGPLPRGN